MEWEKWVYQINGKYTGITAYVLKMNEIAMFKKLRLLSK